MAKQILSPHVPTHVKKPIWANIYGLEFGLGLDFEPWVKFERMLSALIQD